MKEQSVLKEFSKYVSLNVASMLGLSFYILADTFFVAQGTGANGLAALNLAIPVYSVISGTGLMAGVGGATRFAISGSKSVFTHSSIAGGALASIYFICGLFLSPVIAALLGAGGEVFEMTRSYLQILLLFSPMFIANDIVSCFVRNDGDPRLAMAATMCGTLTNIVFDYIFIFPLGLGITGAALATGFAPLVSLAILSAHFFGKKNTLSLVKTAPSFKAAADIFRLGASSFINELSSGIVMLVFNVVILRLEGELGVAAYGITANISLVVISIFTGIAQGSQPRISRCYGRGRHADTVKALRYGFISALAFSALFYVITFIFTPEIVAVFNGENDRRLAEASVHGFRIYFTSVFFSGINILCASYLSSVDRPKSSFIISILRGIALIVPLTLLMSYFFKMNGVWLSLTVCEASVSVLALVLLNRVKDKRI